jgi:glycosyltransferase involved in cell wall biosynthesis
MNKPFEKYVSKSLSKFSELDYSSDPDIIVVIPAINEPGIFRTYESLKEAQNNNKVLVLTVVNYSEKASEEVKLFNQELFDLIIEWGRANSNSQLAFQALFVPDVRRKHAGAGYARKVGMDTATEIFSEAGNEKGMIVSLDADCTVDNNYFTAIVSGFNEGMISDLQVFDFDHDKSGFSEDQRIAMLQYELYLHYFVVGLRLAGFPYAYHTIGSCFAVSVDLYVKNGGMNRKHAGEDFYFLHKLFPNCNVKRNYGTIIHPSGRLSDRVPFGTGPALTQILTEPGHYYVYNPSAFEALSRFFDSVSQFYMDGLIDFSKLDEAMIEFLTTIDFKSKVLEAKQNSSTEVAFAKRLFGHFDAFQIVKFLNFAHENGYYKKAPVVEACCNLLKMQDCKGVDLEGLLKAMKELERNTNLR